jgi:hypothetical protein
LGLKGSDATGGGGGGIPSPKNTFVRVGTISQATQNQDYKPHESFSSNIDIGVEFKVVVEGLSFEPNLSVLGNFARDPQTRDISGWGSAFKVADLFAVLGFNMEELELDANNRIPEEYMKALIGKKITYLSYVNTKGKTSNWDRFCAEENAETFGDFFYSDWESSGYPKNYAPNGKIIKATKAPASAEDNPFGNAGDPVGGTGGITV